MAKSARPPVIAVMGHIDHGKSSLLDYIRKENVVDGEVGGITQHVAAYIAEHNGRHITFLDTPGHEAFKTLRSRGAAAADIAILVVAADEGVMPQTLDALAAITESSIPYLVAITKIDKNNADIERAKNSMLEHGIYLEGLGGDIAYAPISSKTGEGIPELLDLVLLASDIAEPLADAAAAASGFVLESSMDPKRGASATLIVKDGTLSQGDFVVAGGAFAPVRYIENFRGERVDSVGPSAPARIAGFSALPEAGAIFTVEKTKKLAEAAAQRNAQLAKSVAAQATATPEGAAELPLIVKADVAGSVDAILHELAKITHERASIRIVATGVGSVSENDVKTAYASGATIIGFNVGTEPLARDLADRDHVAVRTFSIIYELSQEVVNLLTAAAPEIDVEQELGRAKVLKTFSSGSKKQVLGARLVSGGFTLGAKMKVLRGDAEITRGSITNLQQARADVKEIRTEGEFGLEIEAREDAHPGDFLVTFTVVKA